MGHQEAGNPASFPADFTIPDDGDSLEAASFNVAYEALADRTAFLKAGKLSPGTPVTITATNPTYATPVGARLCHARLLGGGGGGGGGAHGIGTTNLFSSGGGGGGGAIAVEKWFLVNPAGELLALVVGAGGLGAAAELDGTSGGTTSITKVTGSVLVASALGGGGGSRGTRTVSGNTLARAYGAGGPSPRPDSFGTEMPIILPENGGAGEPGIGGMYALTAPHQGACGRTYNDMITNARGGGSPTGFRGGANGTNANSPASLYQPGGVGGGGGASSDFFGQNGGNGGAANGAGVGGAGTNGNHGSGFNDGRGGGGGGGGGGGSGGGGAGGLGGDGAAGNIVLTFYGDV